MGTSTLGFCALIVFFLMVMDGSSTVGVISSLVMVVAVAVAGVVVVPDDGDKINGSLRVKNESGKNEL